MLPHLDAAWGLARFLLRNDADAEDVVQESFLRALRHFGGYRGEGATQGRAWVLTIVRNMAHTWQHRRRAESGAVEFDETTHAVERDDAPASDAGLARREVRESLAEALDRLPPELREALVLREIEGLSYKEIASVTEVPMGTVMSRLSRARQRLQQVVNQSGGR